MGKMADETALTKRDPKPSRKTQYFATLSATFSGLALGAVVSYSSPAVPKLQDPISPADGSLRLTEEQCNWFSSTVNLAAGVGALLCGAFMDRFGRRLALLVLSALGVIGWILIAAGPNYTVLMIGRLLTGIQLGAASVAGPAYVGEIASADIRGTLSGCFQVMVTCGNLWGYAFGAVIHSWRWLAGMCAVPATLCLICMLFSKETPVFLLMKEKKEQAIETLQYFRGKHYDVSTESEAMQQFIEELRQNKASIKDLFKPYNLKPFMICSLILIFVQTSGITPVLLNLLTVFKVL